MRLLKKDTPYTKKEDGFSSVKFKTCPECNEGYKIQNFKPFVTN